MHADYTFAVSKVRALETNLITHAQLERMVAAQDDQEVLEILGSLGWEISSGADYDKLLSDRQRAVWEELSELASDSQELKVLIIKNDFQNLKAALKALLADKEPEPYYVYPTTLDTSVLLSVIAEKKFYELPKELQDTVSEAYELITSTLDGQLAEVMLDQAALKLMRKKADALGNPLISRYVEFSVVSADIKTAYRAANNQKKAEFTQSALCGSEEFEPGAFAHAAEKGVSEVLSFIESTSYAEAAELLKSSTSAFEKWCDNQLVEIVGEAKLKSFGIEPLIAYYVANETEIKAVRIILICKKVGAAEQEIRERLRELYV